MKRFSILIMLCMAAAYAPAQTFERLPLGEIKAGGWLRKQIERDITSGYISIYDKLQPTMQGDVFGPKKAKNYSIDKDGNWETRRETWWPGEHEGYWADLVVRTGFVADYLPWQQKARKILDYVVANQTPEGYIGIYDDECRLDNLLNENGELWTQSRMLNALLAYYEYTGEKRYCDAAKRAADYTISRFESSGKTYFQQPKPNGGGLTHGLAYCETLEWLHRFTNDPKYLRFALWLYDDYSRAKPELRNIDCQLANLLDREKMFKEHSVHVIEHIRVVFWLSQMTNRDDLHRAANNIFYKYARSEAPTGTIVTDPVVHESVMENFGSGDLSYEYCSITEGVISFTSALQKFGHPELGDLVENMMFNAAQGARLPDGKAISYITSDNRSRAVEADGFRNQVAACHKVACCNLNAGKIASYYTAGMWMRLLDRPGVAAMLYGPSKLTTTIGETKVSIDEKTMYPFENQIILTIDPQKEATFTVALRNPAWSKNTAVTSSPGSAIERTDGYILITNRWKKGDKIEVVFDDPVTLRRNMNNELHVQKGALVYAMPVEDKRLCTKTFDHANLANYDVTPKDTKAAEAIFGKYLLPANPAALLERNPAAYRYTAAANASKDYPFDTPYSTIRARFVVNGKHAEFTLVPLGSTVLRKITFKEDK